MTWPSLFLVPSVGNPPTIQTATSAITDIKILVYSCFKFADAKLLTPEFLESIDPHSSTIVASNTVRSWLTWTALQNLSLAYITLCAKLPLLGLKKLSNFAAFNNLDLATTAAITEYFSLV
ncbi:hypothetical protein QUC31_011584 [Theobroma cacao]